MPFERPLGARPAGGGRTHVRVWAPNADVVAVRVGGEDHPLDDEGFGVRAGLVPARHGDDYLLVADGTAWPDPCSRWQPEGLRGPSRVFDPAAARWTDAGWAPPAIADAVIYELHVGTFTREGTFDAAIEHLPALAELGFTVIELMPVAEFPGTRGWGYDGAYLWSAQSSYGGPEGLARLVDAAHASGLAVILDLVPNHVGASGAQALEAFGTYFTDRYGTFWGRAMNYDDAGADGTREWLVQAGEAWVADLHVDGFRLDAIHAVYDMSARHVLEQFAERVRAARPGTLVISESGLNDPKVMRPAARGGYGHDAAWADDFHHALRTLLTGELDGYYADFGTVAQLAKAFGRPHVHDGDWSGVRGRRFGAPSGDVPPEGFVVFSANHDQIGNRAVGDRLPREVRALAALCTLFAPFTPLVFQGEEYGEDAPFQFFTDHIDEDIAEATRTGRREEFASFAAFAGEDVPDPQAVETFSRSKLTRVVDEELLALYRRMLALRRELPPGDVSDVAFDEEGRWLRVARGPFELVANLADEPQAVPAGEGALAVATSPECSVGDGVAWLPAKGGVVLSAERPTSAAPAAPPAPRRRP
jgi:maltooligosyltrehalose trehalohydrolase